MRRNSLISSDNNPIRTDKSLEISPDMLQEASGDHKSSGVEGFESVEVMADGSVGLVFDRVEKTKAERMAKFGERYMRALSLADQRDTTFASTDTIITTEDNGMKVVKKKGVHDESSMKILQMKDRFSQYDCSMNGLAPKGSKEARQYQEAMALLRSGKVVLPTVDEYEKQKKELEEREGNLNMDMNNNQTPIQAPSTPQSTKESPKSVNNKVDMSKVARAEMIEPNKQATSVEPVKPAPINLAKMERDAKIAPEKTPVVHNQPVIAESNPEVVFNVPEGSASVFAATLPDSEKDKIRSAKVIKINEVALRDIPTATRTIDSLSDYRKIVPRQVTGEYYECVLLNSGYSAVTSGAPSLELASAIRDPETNYTDYGAQYKLAFNHLVQTSVGSMSFAEFVAKTSPTDIPLLIASIFRGSQADEQTTTLTCGNREKCGKDYPTKYRISELQDVSGMDSESIAQMNNIIKYRDNLAMSKQIQDNAPVNRAKLAQINDSTILVIKHTDGQMVIERNTVMNDISEQYNPVIAILLLSVKEIHKTIQTEGMERPETFRIVDPYAIAEELFNMSDDEMATVVAATKEIETFDVPRWSLKGPIKCPYCGREEDKVWVDINDLVFLKVSNFVSSV